MITSFRLDQQTSRWARFASVTVDVDPAPELAVTVAPQAHPDEAIQMEADCAARTALSQLPDTSGYRVTVTDIQTSDTDTRVGDVHEATTRAIWQAVGQTREHAYVGFREPEMVARWLRDRIGLPLTGVTEARHWFDGERSGDETSLIHAWLHFENRPPTELHGRGDDLLLSTCDPYQGFSMDEYGEIRVTDAAPPDLLASVVGHRLTDAAVILGPFSRPTCAGLLMRLDQVQFVIGTFCDEWVLTTGEPPAHLAPYWQRQPWITGVCSRSAVGTFVDRTGR